MIRLHGTVCNSELHCVRKFKTGINLMSFICKSGLQETCMNSSHFFLYIMVRHECKVPKRCTEVIRRQYIEQIIFFKTMHNEEDVPNILAVNIPFILWPTLAHFYYLFGLL